MRKVAAIKHSLQRAFHQPQTEPEFSYERQSRDVEVIIDGLS